MGVASWLGDEMLNYELPPVKSEMAMSRALSQLQGNPKATIMSCQHLIPIPHALYDQRCRDPVCCPERQLCRPPRYTPIYTYGVMVANELLQWCSVEVSRAPLLRKNPAVSQLQRQTIEEEEWIALLSLL